MMGAFFRLTNGIPLVNDIRERETADGVRVPYLHCGLDMNDQSVFHHT